MSKQNYETILEKRTFLAERRSVGLPGERIQAVPQMMKAQLFAALLLTVAGCVLLFLGLYFPPEGEIHESVLVAFGEVSTFAGSLFGIDYHYKKKTNGGGAAK